MTHYLAIELNLVLYILNLQSEVNFNFTLKCSANSPRSNVLCYLVAGHGLLLPAHYGTQIPLRATG